MTAPSDQADREQRRRARLGVDGRVGERRLEERCRARRRRPGSGRCRRRSRAPRAVRHRDLHRAGSRSAMWWLGAREADVGVLDLAGGGVRRLLGVVRGGPASSSRASAHGLAAERAEDHPERVDRRSGTRRRSRRRRGPSASRRGRRGQRGSRPWRRSPRTAGRPTSARPPMTKQANVNGIALRKPPIRSRLCSPAIAAMIEPAAMNSSALKNACVIRWNRPATYAPLRDAHDHVADLGHRRVGDDALQVGDDERDRGGDAAASRSRSTAPTSAAVGASSKSGCMRAIR